MGRVLPAWGGLTASTDTTPPLATISTPSGGANVPVNTSVTVTGHATDVGGVVAAIEISTNGSHRWHPATGATAWSYTWHPTTTGTTTILVRATDDSGNPQTTPTSRTITVT